MAMNKKEREQLDATIREAQVNKALRWSDYDVEPDLPRPSYDASREYTNGWSINTHNGRAYKTWSLYTTHGDGWVEPGERHNYGSQGGISQYSTKEKALKALRVKLENNFAKALADVDVLIQLEKDKDEGKE